MQEADDLIILTVMDKSPDAPGKIKLFFSVKPALELKEWVTTDAQNLDTRVELSGVNRTEEVDAAMFDIKSVAIEQAAEAEVIRDRYAVRCALTAARQAKAVDIS